MKASRRTKLCSYFYFYFLYNILKDQRYRINRSLFNEWLFGPEKFSGLSRNGPQASILRHSMYHHHIYRAIYHVVKLIVDLILIPYLWFGMSDSSTTQCDVISSFCRHVLRWRDNRRLEPFGFRWLYFS